MDQATILSLIIAVMSCVTALSKLGAMWLAEKKERVQLQQLLFMITSARLGELARANDRLPKAEEPTH